VLGTTEHRLCAGFGNAPWLRFSVLVYIQVFEIQTFYFFTPPYPTRLCPSSIHLLKCLTLIGSRKFHCSVYFFFLTLLENVLIENGPKVLCPSYHRYTSQFIATSLAPPFMPRPSLSPLMMLQRNLKIIETKEMRGPYKWQRTKQAERKERQDAKLTVLDATTSAECE